VRKCRLRPDTRSGPGEDAACLILKPGSLRYRFGEFLKDKEIAKFKLPERLYVCDDFPVSAFARAFSEDARRAG
jgi:2,3-dihydroxybenzoate-AMP ligase